MQSTLLSTIISRMQRWQPIATIEEQYLIRDLDEAIRARRRKIRLPWHLKKGTLKIFDEVLEYPIATDHDELAYLDIAPDKEYADKARYHYTSLQQFYEDPTNRNEIAEIWDNGEKYLGVRYKGLLAGSKRLSTAEEVDDYEVSDDADAVALDNVNYKQGNGSMKITITSSAGTAPIKNTFTAFTDSKYKKKYHFRCIYLDAVPTSIEMRFQVDDSNYLSIGAITTQFSGQAFKADAWNLIAFDLNTATETGTIATTSSWASEKVILTGAETGTYYLDDSYLREWILQDYWYYSKYSVLTSGATSADQEFFFESESYSPDSSLVGDNEWIDIIMYDALLLALTDKENKVIKDEIRGRLADAEEDLYKNYPELKPVIITNRYRFTNDFNSLDSDD